MNDIVISINPTERPLGLNTYGPGVRYLCKSLCRTEAKGLPRLHEDNKLRWVARLCFAIAKVIFGNRTNLDGTAKIV